jgi:hypothetical protein
MGEACVRRKRIENVASNYLQLAASFMGEKFCELPLRQITNIPILYSMKGELIERLLEHL